MWLRKSFFFWNSKRDNSFHSLLFSCVVPCFSLYLKLLPRAAHRALSSSLAQLPLGTPSPEALSVSFSLWLFFAQFAFQVKNCNAAQEQVLGFSFLVLGAPYLQQGRRSPPASCICLINNNASVFICSRVSHNIWTTPCLFSFLPGLDAPDITSTYCTWQYLPN